FFFSSRRRHTRFDCDWSSDVCSSDLLEPGGGTFRFEAILDTSLPEPELRQQVVVTLLAVLELARLKVIRVLQDAATGEFYVAQQIGRASCRERVEISGGDGAVKYKGE